MTSAQLMLVTGVTGPSSLLKVSSSEIELFEALQRYIAWLFPLPELLQARYRCLNLANQVEITGFFFILNLALKPIK